MKKMPFIVLLLYYSTAFCQKPLYKQPASFGIHFTFTDFETAMAIRNSSISAAWKDGLFGKFENMSQGLAISYGTGLSNHFDYSTTLIGSFLTYPVPGEGTLSESLLLEIDATVRAKLLPDKFWFIPYLQAGAGLSKYEGYWGTFIPAGVGIQISFFGEAYLIINSQYRIAISESASDHFVHTIGLVGNIGKRS